VISDIKQVADDKAGDSMQESGGKYSTVNITIVYHNIRKQY